MCHNYKGFSIHLGKPTTFLRTDWSPSPPGPPPPLPRLLSSCSQSHHNRPRRCAAAAIVATAVAANSAAAVAAAAARTSFNFQIEKMCRNSSPSLLKGQSNEISDLQFFSSFEPAWANDQWVKIFIDFGLVFAELFKLFGVSYRNEAVSPAVWYCAVSISLQYHTAGSHVTFPDPI